MFRTQLFPYLPALATFVEDKKFVSETQNVPDIFHKNFLSVTNASRFGQHGNNHGQHCVRNTVFSFATALSILQRRTSISIRGL